LDRLSLSATSLPSTSRIGVYGGIAMASRAKEIFSTIRNGMAKNTSIHR
jgi:hypothetical protein